MDKPELTLHPISEEESQMPRWSDMFIKQPIISLRNQANVCQKKGSIPVIVDRMQKARIDLSRHKFMVPTGQSFGALTHMIRKKRKSTAGVDASSQALLFFVIRENGEPPVLCVPNMLVSHIYNEHKWSNGFLFINFDEEATFGSLFL